MPVNQESFNNNLFKLLKTKDLNPSPMDSKGRRVPVPAEADIFKIQLIDNIKENSSTGIENTHAAWVTVDDAQQLTLYYDDEATKDSDKFSDLLKHLKNWAQRRQLGFELVNRNHLDSDMAKREHMKNKKHIDEGYHPVGKKASYNDSVPKVKIILQHTRPIEEGEQRFRNIAKIFVENLEGERFLVPTIRPGVARVYARHLAEGGTPYDEKGKHITSLVEEYTKMAGFVRATKNGQFNESAQKLVNEGINHYHNLRETLSRMTGHRGYNNYFESWTPVLNEQTDEITNLNELFVQETLDPRIENVLPILNRLSKNITEMNEVKELAEWAESLTEVETESKEEIAEEVTVKYEVVDKNGNRVGTWDGMVFKAYDRSKFPAGIMDKIPMGARVDKESGPLDDKHMAMSKAGLEEESLDEINLGKAGKALAATAGLAAAGIGGEHMAKMPNINQIQGHPDFVYDLTQTLAQDPKYRSSMQSYYDAINDPETSTRRKQLAQKYERDQYFRVWADTVNKLKQKEPTVWNKIKNFVKSTFSEDVEEGLDANQKRAGQLGPTEKVGSKGAVGKLVGASESVELDRIKSLSGIK